MSAPSIDIPAPSAAALSAAPEAIKIFLSSTFKLATCNSVFVPNTFKLPFIVTSLVIANPLNVGVSPACSPESTSVFTPLVASLTVP